MGNRKLCGGAGSLVKYPTHFCTRRTRGREVSEASLRTDKGGSETLSESPDRIKSRKCTGPGVVMLGRGTQSIL